MATAWKTTGFERLLKLCELSGRELDERFRAGEVGRMPDGPAVGLALAQPALWPCASDYGVRVGNHSVRSPR